MKMQFSREGRQIEVNLAEPIDLSVIIRNGLDNPSCFWAPPVEFSPVVSGDFIGSTAKGGPLNFFNIRMNPHGNGTHTECVGHIAREHYVLHECLSTYHFWAKLVSLYPRKLDSGDRVIFADQLEEVLKKMKQKRWCFGPCPMTLRKLLVTTPAPTRHICTTRLVLIWPMLVFSIYCWICPL